MNRREFVRSMLAAGTLVAASSSVFSMGAHLSDKNVNDTFLEADEYRLLALVSQLIFPVTDTAGAVEAGVPKRIDIALAKWADEEYRNEWREGLTELSKQLDREAGGKFVDQSKEKQIEVMTVIDREGLTRKRANLSFYKEIKSSIATAYYTSKPGATEELIYSAVPGEWKPCVPYAEIGRAWATGML